jgi:hypothetical protein
MQSKSIITGGIVGLIAIACMWSVMAAFLSAYEAISVVTELASYWLALFIVVGGGWLYLRKPSQATAQINLRFRSLVVIAAFMIVVISWRLSTSQFFFWKMRSIPRNAWPRMASDLEVFGRQMTETGINYLPTTESPPKSLQRLGLGEDYKGGVCNIWNASDYSGVFAIIAFGYKGRSWGLCLGPEMRAKEYCRRGKYVNVASNAYFFCGPRD